MCPCRSVFFAILCASLAAMAGICAAVPPEEAARQLVERVLPDKTGIFSFEASPNAASRDAFSYRADDGKVSIRGTSVGAMAAGLRHYLQHTAHADQSIFWGNAPFTAAPAGAAECTTPFVYRYCFNYCCFSYSMAWWDWQEWEKAIDWMALHGINMPLAVTGQEAVWQQVGRRLGLSDADLETFFVGPAYLPFGWMGCIDGWAGPLPQRWIDAHLDLGKKIAARERELGMTPVLQGFTGHVPAALKKKFPEAKFQQLPSWCGFPGTLFLDPADPLFERVGKLFIEEQTKAFGTDHLYASDTFIEMSPPSNDPAFLARMGEAVYKAMAAGDAQAVWVMQGWLFVNNPNFWKPPQAKALLGAVPDNKMIVLDLFCESDPAWSKTESFYGKPWIWCIIQSFGNQVSLHGGLPQIAEELPSAFASEQRGKLCGTGFIMEGLGHNPVVYDLLSDLTWKPDGIKLDEWIADYAISRYGQAHPKAADAWRILIETAYRSPGQTGSVIQGRPSLSAGTSWNSGQRAYDPVRLAEACRLLLEASDALGSVDTYQYDLTHVTRQVLANHAAVLRESVAGAYRAKDRKALAEAGNRFLGLIDDVDELLATRTEFLLGDWLEQAKRWGTTEEERRHYEWNARNQVTLWGAADSTLHDYASKQWAGLTRDFYRGRWERFITTLDRCLEKGEALKMPAFDREIRTWEEQWTHGTELYAAKPVGDSLAVARRLFDKYQAGIFEQDAVSLTTGKPATSSAALPPYPANLANDGHRNDTDRYWATDVNKDSAAWWQVDLQEAKPVGKVVVVFYYGDERSYGFAVETSMDGSRWDLAADYRDKPQPATRDGVTCTFAPRPARYLRVTLSSNSANTGRHLVEVMAY